MSTILFELWEGLRSALRAVRLHVLRSALTTLGIVIGIISVTGMATIINGLERDFEESMAELGSDVLYVTKWPMVTTPGFKWWNYINRPPIEEELLPVIRERVPLARNVSAEASTGRIAQYKSETLEGVDVTGVESAYERIHAVPIERGRFFTEVEDHGARAVGVIGAEVAEKLFPVEDPIGKTIRLGDSRVRVIGVTERQGAAGDTDSDDTRVMVPFGFYEMNYGISRWNGVRIHVQAHDSDQLPQLEDQLIGALRVARGLDAMEENDFEIGDQSNVREQIGPIKGAIYGVGIFLTALALVVGGIGVMNIMYVSVKERTREIGLRKAVGARPRTILIQFMLEAILVCLMGGLIGVGLSVGLTSVINALTPFQAFLPFATVMLALAICTGVGIVFGLGPAWQAARAQPIEALRYE